MDESQILVITKIINAQEAVMGPFANDLAHRVPGLRFDGMRVSGVEGNFRDVLQNLVKQYSSIFGQSSIEVCKDALGSVQLPLDKNSLPLELMIH